MRTRGRTRAGAIAMAAAASVAAWFGPAAAAMPGTMTPQEHDGGAPHNGSEGSTDDPFDALSVLVGDPSNEDGSDDPEGQDPDETAPEMS